MATSNKPKDTTEKKNLLKRTLENPAVWSFLAKITLGALLFIIAFNTSTTKFFNDNPIFGVRFLAEITIGLAAFIFGFHTIPIIALKIRDWSEYFIAKEIEKIVTGFWDEQSKRMSKARRDKDKKKKAEEVKKNKALLKSSVVVDTSVLIDGRLLDIAKTGFMDFDIVVPECVLDELQLISDGKDDLKRQRGRRGLDMAAELKRALKVRVFKDPDDVSKKEGVDKELVRLAKKYKMKIMTVDFNLNKVAKASGLDVLNVNELANAVKTNVIPGENLKIKIVQEGKEKNQGVGYLEDGTMIVVEKGRSKVGEKVTTKVSRIIQTDAVKMIFTELQ